MRYVWCRSDSHCTRSCPLITELPTAATRVHSNLIISSQRNCCIAFENFMYMDFCDLSPFEFINWFWKIMNRRFIEVWSMILLWNDSFLSFFNFFFISVKLKNSRWLTRSFSPSSLLSAPISRGLSPSGQYFQRARSICVVPSRGMRQSIITLLHIDTLCESVYIHACTTQTFTYVC